MVGVVPLIVSDSIHVWYMYLQLVDLYTIHGWKYSDWIQRKNGGKFTAGVYPFKSINPIHLLKPYIFFIYQSWTGCDLAMRCVTQEDSILHFFEKSDQFCWGPTTRNSRKLVPKLRSYKKQPKTIEIVETPTLDDEKIPYLKEIVDVVFSKTIFTMKSTWISPGNYASSSRLGPGFNH